MRAKGARIAGLRGVSSECEIDAAILYSISYYYNETPPTHSVIA